MSSESDSSDVNPTPDIDFVCKKLTTAIKNCKSEEDLRISIELVLRDSLPGLPTPKYEKSVRTSTFSGRADAVHTGVVIEYERPRSLRSKSHRLHSIEQVCDYITGFRTGDTATSEPAAPGLFGPDSKRTQQNEERLSSNVGVVTDGEEFIFVQRRAHDWHLDHRHLEPATVEKLLLWLRTMNRKDLSPENLIHDFGPESELATEIVGILAHLVSSRKHPKANVIYEEWQRIFGIVYGTEQLERTGRDAEATHLAAAYKQDINVEFSILLFSVHTYYALLMKLLATEVIVAQGGFGGSFIGNLTQTTLRDQLASLESGEILQRYNIRNAIEQDFFGWYPEAWTRNLGKVLWNFGQALSTYDIATFELRPDRARDLLKDLYHGLIPEAVRHALGEYYTPDWLAEHTLNMARYDGDPRTTLLDPSCGSGTFLVQAIHRVRQWLSDRPIEWGSAAQRLEATRLIRRNIVGFDLNPLAVIASRTNYLFAMGPLLRYRELGSEFEVPVYLTDSVLLPGRKDDQPDLFAPDTVSFPMTVGTFDIPTVVVDKHQVPELMNLLHECLTEGHDVASFVSRSVNQLGLEKSTALQTSLETLFLAMKELERQGKDHVWAKLIRNRYASVFFRDYFDFVVGNPPHVNWESLTIEWRGVAEAAYRHYGLFTLKGLESRHGGGKKDIAALFTYAVMDHFVKTGGTLALVLHVSLFKTSGAGEGFRRFQLGDGAKFSVDEAHDFKSFQPFQTYAGMRIKTRTLSIRAIKGQEVSYPVPYHVWTKTERGFIPGNLDWSDASKRLACQNQVAVPLRGNVAKARLSPWLTVPKSRLKECNRIIAGRDYKPHYIGHEGLNTGGLNGAYFLEVLERFPNGMIRVRNEHDTGKIKCPQVEATIEADLVYPLLRGRSMARWKTTPAGDVLVLQDPATQSGYSVEWLQRSHPLTWAYIKRFEKLLRNRKAFLKFFNSAIDAFYSMYSVGNHTFARHKVVWMDISETVKAAVLSATSKQRLVIPEHTVIFISTTTEDEAHYVAAVLNSHPVNMVVSGYAVDNHVSTHPIENIVIPRYDPKNRLHVTLVGHSRAAHIAASRSDDSAVQVAENLINDSVPALWN